MTGTAPTSPFERAAREYAALGRRVFPLRPADKRPLFRHWRRRATAEVDVIRRYWRECPDANVGVACEGLVVLDADSEAAERSLRGLDLPETPMVRTPRGTHRYFLGHVGNRVGVLPGVDVRGAGGYVVGAGSVDALGFAYHWLVPPNEVPFASAPAGLLRRLRKAGSRAPADRTTRLKRSEGSTGAILRGYRNTTLTRMAGSLRRAGISDRGIASALDAENKGRCVPPLESDELQRILGSAEHFDGPPPWLSDSRAFHTDPALDPKAHLVLWTLSVFARDNGVCYPSYDLLRQLTGLHRNTIAEAIKTLERARRIKVERRPNRPNLIRLLPYKPFMNPQGSGSSGTEGVHGQGEEAP